MPHTYDLSRASASDGPVASLRPAPSPDPGPLSPHNADAERAVLGAMLSSRDAVGTTAEVLTADDFYVGLHANLYAEMLELYSTGDPVEPLTLAERLRADDALERSGGLAFLRGLTADVLAPSSVGYYAKIVHDHAVRRNLLRTARNIIELADDKANATSSVVEFAETALYGIGEHRTTGSFARIGELLDGELERLSQMQENGERVVGLATGFADFDRLTAGLQPSNLMIVAARPGMGKSTFMANMAAHVAIREQRTVAFFTLEMSKTEVTQRVLCAEGRVKASHMKNGMLTDSDWDKIMAGVQGLYDVPLHIEDSAHTTLMDIRTKARRLAAQTPGGLGLVVVDYLQLMSSGNRRESRQVEISEISRGLKILARELECPVVVASQLNRSPEGRADKRPMLGDLRESGAIEQDADIVAFLYRDDYYNAESDALGEAELIIAKHRNGPTDTIKLLFVEHQSRFADIADTNSNATF